MELHLVVQFKLMECRLQEEQTGQQNITIANSTAKAQYTVMKTATGTP